jgi:arylsulfatase A
MDDAFGRLLRALDELGLRENTLVFFSSDNGPAVTRQHPHGSSGPLRDKKGSLYEGGIRVPGILRWPGRTKPGAVSDELVCFMDLLPTVCAITGIPVPSDRALDGASFLPVLEGRPIARRTPLYWHFTWANAGPQAALRRGDWKIVAHLEGLPKEPRRGNIIDAHSRAVKSAELGKMELYNLRADIGETTDLREREPARFEELAALLRAKYREVRAEAPVWPVWDDPGYEQQRIEWPEYVAPTRPAPRKK